MKEERTKKTYTSAAKAPCINLAIRWMAQFTTKETSFMRGVRTLVTLNRKLDGPHTSSESCGEKKSPWP